MQLLGAGDALYAQLTDLQTPLDPVAEATLRARVCAYVDELKDLGWPPERVIVAVTKIAHQAGLHPTLRVVRTDQHIDGTDKVLVDMVGWCVERYFFGR